MREVTASVVWAPQQLCVFQILGVRCKRLALGAGHLQAEKSGACGYGFDGEASVNAMRMPWAGRDVPHAVLDILRGCNITCPGCYNDRPPDAKSLADIAAELDQLLSLRRLHTVTLSGGDPLLHPELPEIVRLVKSRGVKVAILSNGLLADDEHLPTLKAAGLDILFLHIQSNQRRADLPGTPTWEKVSSLRERKCELAARHGLDVGLSVIAYQSSLDELRRTVEQVIASPQCHFLLVTLFTDFKEFGAVRGGVREGLVLSAFERGATPVTAVDVAGDSGEPGARGERGLERVGCDDIKRLLGGMGLRPFAYLGSSRSRDEAKWLFYLGMAYENGTQTRRYYSFASGLSDRALVRLARRIAGRYLFLYKSSLRALRVRVLLNALSGGRFLDGLRASRHVLRADGAALEKHLLFQEGPFVDAVDGVITCRDCPDATLWHGRLVPLCLVDHMREGGAA